MKKYDIVKLVNETPYKQNNLQKDMRGIIFRIRDCVEVLFFNNLDTKDYAIVNINKNDLVVENQTLPEQLRQDFLKFEEKILRNAKNFLTTPQISAYQIVELLVEDEKYTKLGIHKGDRGCIMSDKIVANCVEVDFSGIDKKGNYYGDCIPVKIKDVKIIKQ